MTDRQPTETFPADRSAQQATSLPGATPGASAPPADEPLPRAFGRYELRTLLGRGGMGRVYLAHDPHLDRLVALKMPNPVEVAGWRERFLTEARAAATLTHPNVCPVYDVGEVDGQPYLTMAYIEGETLAARLQREGTLAPGAAIELVRTVARAMHEAHRRGIVHRDLKPANLMLDPAGRPVVMDFGLAIRPPPADDLRLTLTGVALGTPAYMPPEQASGEHDAIGPTADVYSLGVILFELVTGRVPFKAKSFGKLLAQIERDAPPRPSSLNPAVDEALEAIILTALAKSPTDRFAAAGDLADALDRHQQGDRHGLVSLYSKPYVIPDATGEYVPSPSRLTTAARPRPRRRSWLLAGAAALVLAAAGAAIYVETDYGQIVVQLSDPNAKVDVRVNGQEVTLAVEGGKPVRVRAGKGQKLEISGAEFETVSESFDLKRGDVHLARVTLRPRADLAQKEPDGPKVEPRPKDPVAVDPVKKEPPKPVPYPEKSTLIEVPGWQVLTDATKEQMQAWLDERKKAKHSVMWLDAVQVGDKPLFSAVAALDPREPDWVALLDEDANNIIETARKHLHLPTYHVASVSGYPRGELIRSCSLWHPGARSYRVAARGDLQDIQPNIDRQAKSGFVARILRVYPCGGDVLRYSGLLESAIGVTAPWATDLDEGGLTTFLEAQRKAGRRPVVTACPVRGQLRWAAATAEDKTAADWVVDRDLSLAEFKAKAAEMAGKGFTPASVTAHPHDGAVRYCVVWVKEPPKPVKYPDKPTLVEVGGWQVYADASHAEMRAWLDERKKDKHSVLWLDSFEVAGKPAFAAAAALDDRRAKWVARLDLRYPQFAPGVPLMFSRVDGVADQTTHSLASVSGYPEDKTTWQTALWHERQGGSRWLFGFNVPTAELDATMDRVVVRGTVLRQLRPHRDAAGTVRWAYHLDEQREARGLRLVAATPAEVTKFFEDNRGRGMRPGAMGACESQGKLVFGATMYSADPEPEWDVSLGLNVAELKEQAKKKADSGFAPDSVTGYTWNGAVRYCVVWVKEPSPAGKASQPPQAPAPRPKP